MLNVPLVTGGEVVARVRAWSAPISQRLEHLEKKSNDDYFDVTHETISSFHLRTFGAKVIEALPIVVAVVWG